MKEKRPLFAGVRALIARRHEQMPLRTRRRHLGIRLLLLATFIAPLAMADLADSTTYTIQFFGGPENGILPTAGGFTYDPDTATFSSFVVIWDSITFDLTSAANAPSISRDLNELSCLGGLSGGAASFALLGGSCKSVGADWSGDTETNGQANFQFFGIDGFSDIFVNDHLDSGPASHDTGSSRDWSVTAVSAPTPAPSVPEPSAAILLLTTLFMVGLVKRGWSAVGCPPPSFRQKSARAKP